MIRPVDDLDTAVAPLVGAAALLADARYALIPVVPCGHCGQALPSDHEHTLLALRARLSNQLLTATHNALTRTASSTPRDEGAH